MVGSSGWNRESPQRVSRGQALPEPHRRRAQDLLLIRKLRGHSLPFVTAISAAADQKGKATPAMAALLFGRAPGYVTDRVGSWPRNPGRWEPELSSALTFPAPLLGIPI